MMKKATALVIDDEPAIRELLELTLARMDIDSWTASSVEDARRALTDRAFDLCLTDMKLPDGNGLDLVDYMQVHYPAIPVAVITAHGNMEAAIRALKSGAFDFISKPVDLKVLRLIVSRALSLGGQSAAGQESLHLLLGESDEIVDIRLKIAKLGRSQAPVFISGESGTGKELVARLIHAASPRSGKPFIAVNCGAIPQDLMESEFFGHRKGSFTGAVADKAGLFQAGDGGTLFLDEIADLPLALQVKLLRAIQEKSVRPVGEAREVPVDVRILSATHKNLSALVGQGLFRQDLFYRINVIELVVPPLRERRTDIPILIPHLLGKLTRSNGDLPAEISQVAINALMRYEFPGNVRELENILERAVALCEGRIIGVEDLNLPKSVHHEAIVDAAPGSMMLETGMTLENYMDEVEKRAIEQVLNKTRWNRTAAARELGITFRALRYKLKKLGLE